MNRNFGSMKVKQQGMVLAVALILLAILTVVGLAAVRSGALQERMAVNQIQGHGTFLDSEQRVWNSAACIRGQYWDDEENDWVSEFPAPDDVEIACGLGVGGIAKGALVVWDELAKPPHYVVTAMEDTFSAGAVTPVVLHVRTPGGDAREIKFPGIPRLAPYVCFGEGCELDMASAKASPTADGYNRVSPSFDGSAECGTQGSNRPQIEQVVDPDTGIQTDLAVPAVIMPDGTIDGTYTTGSKTAKGGNVPDLNTANDPALINYPDDPNLQAGYYAGLLAGTDYKDYKEYIDAMIDPLVSVAKKGTELPQELPPGIVDIYYAGPGDSIELPTGSKNAAGGVIILDGGTISLKGNSCFAGVVLYRNSGVITNDQGSGMSGTPAFLGTVLGYTGFSDAYKEHHSGVTDEQARTMDPRLNGNPSFYFSDKAISDAEGLIGRALGDGKYLEMVQWHSPVGRP